MTMAEKSLTCEIITPEKPVYRGEVDMLIAPGRDGELGILPLHAPLITTLKLGEIRLRHDDNWDYVAISGGYLEVNEDKVIVLADDAEISSKMDIVELEKEKREIEDRIATLNEQDKEFFEESNKLENIVNRLRVAEKTKK